MKNQEMYKRVKDYLSNTGLKNKYQYQASVKKYVIIDFADMISMDYELADAMLECEDVFTLLRNEFKVPILLKKAENLTPINAIRKTETDKIVSVEGTVRQRSPIKPRTYKIKFMCNECGKEYILYQPHSKIVYPGCCPRAKFTIIEKFSEDYTTLNLEELPEESTTQAVKVQVKVREPLTNPEFVNSYSPGDRVSVVGFIREEPVFSGGKPTNNLKRYLDAIYIQALEEKADDTIQDEDYKAIEEIGKLLIENKIKYIVPAVVGHERVKEALLLQLVGGVKKNQQQTIKREMIHILLVGDPSVAKSVMGKSIIQLKPRARYVGGSKGASSVGITAAVVRDEDGNFVLDCGSIVLANGSILVIDEFEKMRPDAVEPLHETLAGGTVSVDKAGVHATMQARTSVLAIANPKFGRWDPGKTIIEQIEMVPSLISRFDFIFPLRDSLNQAEDEKISTKILSAGKEAVDEMDYQMFRKFIIHASSLKPTLTDAAVKELKEYFTTTRERYRKIEGNKVPITFRQLEGLIRLTEAYAKLRLANRASKSDAEQAINIMKYYLSQLGVDLDTATAEIDNIELGETSTHKKADFVINQIPAGEIVEIEDVINACKIYGLDKREVENIVEKMKRDGEIYEPMPAFLKRL